MKLKTKDQIEEHVAAFQGVEPDRKKQLADHLTHLPDGHLPAVVAVLEQDKDSADPEINFVRGCFEDAPATPPPTNGEHPGLPNAA